MNRVYCRDRWQLWFGEIVDFVQDWFAGTGIRAFVRACGQTNQQVAFRLKENKIPRFGPGTFQGKFAIGCDFVVHKNIEGCGNPTRIKAMGLHGFLQILQATRMMLLTTRYHLKHLQAAGSDQKIMPTTTVLHDLEHDGATMGIEAMPFAQEQGFVIVDGAPRGQSILQVRRQATKQVGDLAA